MDFLDPAKKKARTRRLLATYIFIAFAIAAGTLFLGLVSFGYRFNRTTGEVTRSGLLFVSANPESAEIYLNGELHDDRTNTRIELAAGDYKVELKRDGYRPWQRDVQLAGGGIERLVYPLLFPVNLKTSDVQLYEKQPELVTQSPDRRWLVVLKPGSRSKFDVFDLSSKATTSMSIVLPSDVLSGEKPGSLTSVEWSSDNRHVLLMHRFGNQHEYVMLDRLEPELSFNVTALFGVSPDEVALRDKRFDRLYLLDKTTQTLQTADVRKREIKPLLRRVLAFKAHGDSRLLYVTPESAGPGKVNVNVADGKTKNYTVKRLNATEDYILDMARFDGAWYVAVGSVKDSKVYVYKNPLENLNGSGGFKVIKTETVLEVADAAKLSFSVNARFLALQNGQNFAVYDFETNRRHVYELESALAGGELATWMDGHRFVGRSQGKTLVFDYDGANRQLLAPLSSPQPYFDRDYTALFTVAPSQDVLSRSALLSSELVASE